MELFIVLLLVVLVVLAISGKKNKDKLKKVHAELAAIKLKYKPIVDIEAYVDELAEDAKKTRVDTREANAKAKTKLQDAEIKATNIIESAKIQRDKVIETAEQKAVEIAGDAWDVKEKADFYTKTVKAMKNTIEGYNDDYVVPNTSVLDDLADEYDHKEAGEMLKQARKASKDLVRSDLAGNCDYAEKNRKDAAIHFAIDAFNGKVDSALSKVKHDNFGKIQQEINDAFTLVNFNGAPFRNARINTEYLDARLNELKWAVAALELKKADQAEQAEIKAQIREEERAQREMEKARKEAEKEERILQKAMEKARKELAAASEEQRAQFEFELAALEAKLHEAEEKGQRALSMAQQTKRGHVYVISNIGSFGENVYKIGMTRRLEPIDRVKELGDASVPFSFDVHAMIYSENAPELENQLHKRFSEMSVNKVNPRKEFFNVSLAEVKQAVEQTDNDKVHWTLKAEAAEYRESIAIAKQQQDVA
jgi:hypothetical protein